MSESEKVEPVKKLEELWAGDFGQQYLERNKAAANGRDAFWLPFLERHRVANVLEVGCNVGGNLRWIASVVPPGNVHGIDVNAQAIELLARTVPGIKVRQGLARQLPYADGEFDLVLTAGVLIHQPEESILDVMREIVRCSRKYVLALEYFAEKTTEVFYRGQAGALFKRDYGRMYQERFPALRLKESGRLGKDEGWDDVTYWLFEKNA